MARGSERGYPDLELSGTRFGEGFHAIDVKVARRDANPARTRSRITLYTGNTYFRWPQLHWPGTFRPFAEYASHLDLLVIYDFVPDVASRVADPELIVQPAWQIASRQRSSTGAKVHAPGPREQTDRRSHRFGAHANTLRQGCDSHGGPSAWRALASPSSSAMRSCCWQISRSGWRWTCWLMRNGNARQYS